jgi:hypothetical protein
MDVWLVAACMILGALFFAWGESVRSKHRPVLKAVQESLTSRELPRTTASVLALMERISKSNGYQDIIPEAQAVMRGEATSAAFEKSFQSKLDSSPIAGSHVRDMQDLLDKASEVIEDRIHIEQCYNETIASARKTMGSFFIAGALGLLTIILEQIPLTDLRGLPASISTLLELAMAFSAAMGFFGVYYSLKGYFAFVKAAETEDQNAPALPFDIPSLKGLA